VVRSLLYEPHDRMLTHRFSRAPHLVWAASILACGSSEPTVGARDAQADADRRVDAPVLDANDDAVDARALMDGGAVVAAPLEGCTAGTYVATATIGGEQSFSLAIDTGSTTLAVALASCTTCGVVPEYTPGKGAVDEHETVDAGYNGGGDAGASGWAGEIYEDSVRVGGEPPTSMRLVGIDAQSQFLYSTTCGSKNVTFEGILGLAPAKDALSGTQGYFDELVAAHAVDDVFAVELCDPGGTLWLGGYDPAVTTGPVVYVPFSSSTNRDYAYVVVMERVEIAGVSITLPGTTYTDTILDTGNSTFQLPPAAIASFANAIAQSAGWTEAFVADAGSSSGMDAGNGGAVELLETNGCATTSFSPDELDAKLPPVTLVFAGSPSVSFSVPATKSYLVPVGNGGWCSAFYADEPGPSYPFVAALGAPTLRSNVVIFDRGRQRIGFAPHAPCAMP
jgi:hypothetical protein